MEQSVSVTTDTVDVVTCGGCGAQIDVKGITPFAEVECPNCNHTETVPAKLGSFLLVDLMGEGGMGGVYKAVDETLGRQVAIKVMLASLGDDPEFITSFRREAQAIARLNHPHIAQIYSFGTEKGQPYIVMELVSGTRLDAEMEKNEQLDQGLVLKTALQIANGLQAADEAGLVHGDIKPENILYDEKGQAKLVDFGLATAAHEKSQDSAIWGTPYYIPPEKIRRQKLDARADIYSLGGTLYHALTGKPPFDGNTAIEVVKARLEAPPTPIEELRPDIDERLGSIIMRMLELDAARRYPTYSSLLGDLQKCAAESSITMGSSKSAGKKKVVIKKRGGAGRPTKPKATTAPAVPSATGSHKLVVHKSTTGPIAKPPQQEDDEHHAPTPEELAERHARRVAIRKKIISVLITILVIAGVIAGIAGAIAHNKAKHRAQVAYYQLTENKRLGQEAHAQLLTDVEELRSIAAITRKLRDEAEQHAMRVTGSIPDLPPLKLPEPEPEPEVAPEPEGTNDVATATNETAAATNNISEEAVVESSDASVEEAVTDEQEVIVAEEPEATDDLEVPAEEPVELPRIHELFIEVGVAQRDIARFTMEAADILQQAEIASNKLARSGSPAESIPYRNELIELSEKVATQLREAKQLLKKIHLGTRACAKLRETFDEEETARKAEEEAARLRAEEEAAAERDRLAHERKVSDEKAMVDSARAQVPAAIQTHDYNVVDNQIRSMKRSITTPEGRAYLQILMERMEILQGMKQIIIDELTANGYPYGYGVGASARDILKADSRGIYVRGVIAPISWAELNAGDTIRIVDHLLRQPTLKATSRMILATGAAIYCDSFGDRGKEKGNSYADKAINIGMRMEKIQSLRPEGW